MVWHVKREYNIALINQSYINQEENCNFCFKSNCLFCKRSTELEKQDIEASIQDALSQKKGL